MSIYINHLHYMISRGHLLFLHHVYEFYGTWKQKMGDLLSTFPHMWSGGRISGLLQFSFLSYFCHSFILFTSLKKTWLENEVGVKRVEHLYGFLLCHIYKEVMSSSLCLLIILASRIRKGTSIQALYYSGLVTNLILFC